MVSGVDHGQSLVHDRRWGQHIAGWPVVQLASSFLLQDRINTTAGAERDPGGRTAESKRPIGNPLGPAIVSTSGCRGTCEP